MNKILLAAAIAIATVSVADVAYAKPKHHVVHHYKHHKVKKKHIDKVKPVAEEPVNFAALRTHDEDSAAGYWANEAAVQAAMRKEPQVTTKVDLTKIGRAHV